METKRETNIFTVEKYFNFIGLKDFKPSANSLEDLGKIIEHHLKTFIYRNKVLFNAGIKPKELRKPPSLNIDMLFENMVSKKGGYCFQHMELMYSVLTQSKFIVERFLSRVILQPCSKIDLAQLAEIKTHPILIVHINNCSFLIDVGFANESLRTTLRLQEGIQSIDDEEYRLTLSENLWTLDKRRKVENEWLRMYHFFHTPINFQELNEAQDNLFLTEKSVPIRNKLIYGAADTENRKVLVWFPNNPSNSFFKSIKKNSIEEPKILKFSKMEDLKEFANQTFGK